MTLYGGKTLDELEALASELQSLANDSIIPLIRRNIYRSAAVSISALIARIKALEGEVEILRKECGP